MGNLVFSVVIGGRLDDDGTLVNPGKLTFLQPLVLPVFLYSLLPCASVHRYTGRELALEEVDIERVCSDLACAKPR